MRKRREMEMGAGVSHEEIGEKGEGRRGEIARMARRRAREIANADRADRPHFRQMSDMEPACAKFDASRVNFPSGGSVALLDDMKITDNLCRNFNLCG
jgi:hypothetical protein